MSPVAHGPVAHAPDARVAFAPVGLDAVAPALGFRGPDANGANGVNGVNGGDGADGADGIWTRDGIGLRPEGDWLALLAPLDRPGGVWPPPGTPGPVELLGAPGLWRVLPSGEGAHDLPPIRGLAGGLRPTDAQGLAALAAYVDWAAATRRGEVPRGWRAPESAELEEWLPASKLRARSGALTARGELVREPRRLALVFGELARVPAHLPARRRAWLDALLADAQRRWRLVRFGVDAERRVRAEVDLSGVPEPWARPLLHLSSEALVWAVGWVLSPLSFVADSSAASRALERPVPLHRS